MVNPGDGSACKYAGFISYSHHDRKVGEWLHRALEGYRVPKRLVGAPGQHGPVPARLYPIFRDREELSAGVLAEQLRVAISQSRCFILICSPHSAASRWVNEEIEHWFAIGGDPARLLCLIADGEPHAAEHGRPERECLPLALRHLQIDGQPYEPMAAQLNADADGRDNARLKIVAGMLGVGFDDLKRRDLVARNQRLAILASLSVGVAAVTVALAFFAVLAQREAERSRQQGEDLIGFMLGDLRGKLEPLGKLDILDAVGDKALAYFAGLDSDRDPGARALAARAKALRQIGEVRFAQGRPADAVGTLSAALKLQRELIARLPDDNEQLFELGQTEFWVGYAAWQAGQFDRAEQNFREYSQVSQQLVDREPDNARWQTEVAYALNNLGVLAFERRRYAESLPLFEQAASTARTLSESAGLETKVKADVISALSWNGAALSALGRHDEALQAFDEYASRMRALIRTAPDDRRLQAGLANGLSSHGFALIETGRPEAALAIADEGLQLSRALIDTDPDNLDLRASLAYNLQVKAAAHYQMQDWPAARSGLQQADAALTEVLRQDPSRMLIRVTLMSVWDLVSTLAWRDGDTATRDQIIDQALAVAEQTPDDKGYGPLIRATAQLLALERARFDRHDEKAASGHRAAAEAALQVFDETGSSAGRRGARLTAMLALMNGADRIADTGLPDSASPASYSVISFIERRCRGPEQPGLACTRLVPQAAALRLHDASRLAPPTQPPLQKIGNAK